MKRRPFFLVLFALGVIATPTLAADPASLLGKWIQRLPNGKGMVTEFTMSSIAYYPVDSSGGPLGPGQKMDVTYKDLGGPMIGIDFKGGGGLMAMQKSATEILLDFPGLSAIDLVKVGP